MEIIDKILKELETLREGRMYKDDEPTDYIIRICESIVAEKSGYVSRIDWKHLQNKN